jgi:chaperonin GroES
MLNYRILDMDEQYEDDFGEVEEEPSKPLSALIESVNIAEDMDDDELTQIGREAKEGYEADCHSRESWEKSVDEWTKLAKQVVEKKTFPWPGASNVKYPLLSTAAMQFAARAYPSLIPSDGRLVKSRIIGKDLDGTKTKTAEAVSAFMSYQLLNEMEGWEEEMDRLLIMLPVVGTMFKKTYWDSLKQVNCSKIILPKNLVVNYWAKSLREAERISEVLEINPRILKERQQSGLWLDKIELGDPSLAEALEHTDDTPTQADSTTPYIFIEQHTYLDLDKDGYKEPYIVTFHKATSKVFRITARYDDKTTFYTEEDKLAKIEPIQYYTKFGFVPNPDGGFYDIGFGLLLGPINESVNTLINQLVDAGTLNNLQNGFIGKGLRLKMGETRFTPGEWKVVNSTGDDLKKQIVPMPSKEPSKVLFELMGALITSGKELASVAEIFVGKMPGQNTPATTTMASIEQGMKVFTAVYKRIYRSLGEEFSKLYRLNELYTNPNTYVEIVDTEVGPEDFKGDSHRIFPGADPTAVSQSEKLMKAQGLMEMMAQGVPLDPLKVMMRVLEAQEQPNWQELIPPQIMESGQLPEKPDPKMQEMQMKGQLEQQKTQAQIQALAQKSEIEKSSAQAKLAMEAQSHAQEMQHKQETAQIDAAVATHKQRIFSAEKANEMMQTTRQSEEAHQQNLRHTAEQSKAKAEATRKSANSKGAKKE